MSKVTKPTPLVVNVDGIPKELIDLDRWVVWRYEWREGKNDKPGKWTKPPYVPGEHRNASSTDPTTWRTFEDALSDYEDQTCDGPGIASGNGLVGVDLDHCVENGVVASWAQKEVDLLDTYAEISPSGTGVRAFAFGTLPPKGRKKGNVELYDGKRYLTVTGHRLNDKSVEHRQEALTAYHRRVFGQEKPAPDIPEGTSAHTAKMTDAQVLGLLHKAKNRDKIAKLWSGDLSGHDGDASRADMALCSYLLFYTQDIAQVFRLFSASKLHRPKWNEMRGADTYGVRTIKAELAKMTEFYQSPTTVSVSPSRLYRWAELTAMDVAPVPDVVKGFIPGESITMFSGDGGIGKSYVLLEMAMRIAQGGDWLGMGTTKMPVLIIDLENRLRRAIARTKAITRGWGSETGENPDVAITFGDILTLHPGSDIETFYALLEQHDFGLIILDSLVDFLDGLDENSNTDMAGVCKRLRGLVDRTKCSLVAIHHVSKGSSGTNFQSARGASALKDNVDCSIQVTRSAKGMGDTLTMRHDKARDFAYKVIKARLNWGEGMFNTSLLDTGNAKDTMSGDDDEQALLDSLTASEYRKRSDMVQEAMLAAKSSEATLTKKLKRLIDNGAIVEDKTLFGRSTGIKLP